MASDEKKSKKDSDGQSSEGLAKRAQKNMEKVARLPAYMS